MKRALPWILACSIPALAAPLASTPAAAAKYAAEFLRIGVGARALGMGGAFTAVCDDATAAYWNPAGLARFNRPEMLFMHAQQFDNLATHDYFGYVQPLLGSDSKGSVGIAVIRYGVDDILITTGGWNDANHNGQVDPGEVDPTLFRKGSDTEWGVLLTYARRMGDRWDLGGNLKVVRQGLLGKTSFGMGVDMGLLYDLRHDLTLGVRMADLTTTQITWDTGTREVVTPSLTVGARWTRPVSALHGDVVLASDLGMSFDGRKAASDFNVGGIGNDYQGGIEYWFSHAVAFRFGTTAGNWTAGGGLRYRTFEADYAFIPHDDLGDTHRVSASVRF